MDESWGRHRPGPAARLVLFLSRRTPLGRGKGRRLMLRLFARLHRGPADVDMLGANVRLHPADNHAERRALINPERYDRVERDFVAEGLTQPGALYIDIGANFGLYVLDAVLRAPQARILAIEPQRELLERLALNLTFLDAAGHDSCSRVMFVCAAAGAAEGVLHLQPHADASVRALGADAAGDPVPVRPLMTMLEDAGVTAIAVMKIDVEGWEDQVIGPFLRAAPLPLLPRRIVIEHVHRENWGGDSIGMLLRRGYRVTGTTRANTLLELRPTIA